MLKTLIVLPDGTELCSGTGAVNAIQSVAVTECVNDAQDLSLGSTCANTLEVKIITPNGGLNIAAGDEIAVYKVDEEGTRHPGGLFTVEKPTRPTANTMKLTGYDRVSWLDKDLTYWLAGLPDWPYSLYNLAEMVCGACGLTLANEEIPNGTYMVQKFAAEAITGRQLMKWIGQIAGRFCRATSEGMIEFAWYEAANVPSIGNAQGLYYFQNSLSQEDYTIAPIEKVQLQQGVEDVGTIYPNVEGEANTYRITGNYLLSASAAEELLPIAQTLYEQLKDVSYRPCKVSIPASLDIHAGNIVGITDRNGLSFTAYVMTKTTSGQKDTLECTGSHRLESTTAVNNQTYKALSGKVLNLRTDVDGLKVENKNATGEMARLNVTVGGIDTRVSAQESTAKGLDTRLSVVEETATQVKISVQSIQENGVSKVSNEFGLTIDESAVTIHRSGSEMTNSLDEKGMYVIRDKGTSKETSMLQADAYGVIARDVQVHNYLTIGDHARFEDYNNGTDSKRTACFWVGG